MFDFQNTQAFKPKTDITILALQMQETGTYNEMYERPMVVHVDQTAIDGLIERIDSHSLKKSTPALLSGLSYGVIAPAATPGPMIQQINGWDTRKIRFILHVLIQYQQSQLAAEEYYFQGFTNHVGVGINGAIDPNMIFIINNYVRVGQYMTYDDQGTPFMRRRIIESAQIINGEVINNALGCNGYSLRPNDVYMGMQSHLISNFQTDDTALFDTRYQYNNRSVKNNKYNVAPAAYLSNITDSFLMAGITSGIENDAYDIYERAKTIAGSDQVTDNAFFRKMLTIQGRGNGTIFRMSDLEYLNPNIGSVTNFLTIGKANRASFHERGTTEYWNGANLETQYATILGNAVPALMMELMLSRMTFMATNHVMTGNPIITLIDGVSITGVDISQFFEIFKMRLTMEVLNDISCNNQLPYNITMCVDIFGDTIIDIQLSSEIIRYVIPTFCDSIMTPVAVSNGEHFHNLTYSVETILNEVQNAIGQEYAMQGNTQSYI